MRDLNHHPTGWVATTLGEVLVDIVGGGTPSKGIEKYFRGDIPLMTVKDMKSPRPTKAGFNITQEALDNSSARVVPADTVVIATRMGLGKVVRPRCDMAINQDLKALFTSSYLDKSFLEFFLISIAKSLEGMGTGTTVKGLRLEIIRALDFPLAPLNEQKRIVEKIETLFAQLDKGEEAIREVQKLLAQYRQSVLKSAVTGELTADWRAERKGKLEDGRDLLARILKTRREKWEGRGKYKEPVEPDTKDLPELPEGWVWATLPMLGEFGRGKSKHRPRNDERLYLNGTYPFLQTGRIRNSQGEITEYDKLYNEIGLAQSKLWPVGTVCITIAANIAESGILGIDACFPDSVVGLVPSAEIEGSYIEMFIRTEKENLDRYAPATAQKNINLEILNGVAIPLPPWEEQKKIVELVSNSIETARAVSNWCDTELKRSASLRQSILKQAFSGQLVPQDPSDGPASDLLARIASEKATASKKKAPKRTKRKTRA
ncbi:MAG: restriction endonuclease subunit S [Alphaproteobacteria bacterium]|nr:MAG: restriction endonuclease subunit S [Alphaproteobacteria bacterium]